MKFRKTGAVAALSMAAVVSLSACSVSQPTQFNARWRKTVTDASENVDLGGAKEIAEYNVSFEKGGNDAYSVNYSMDEGLCFYVFEKLPAGRYTVGVQAVNYAYLASGFTTTEVTVTDGYEAGIQAPEKQTGVKVAIEGNAITVNSSESAAVAIYNMQGAEVATGMTNTPITVNGRGVFIVKANQKVVKIVK